MRVEVEYSLPYNSTFTRDNRGRYPVTYQKRNNQVIAYASRGLDESQRNYPTHKLEFLALEWAITENFQDNLYDQEFTYTYYNPLIYILSTAKLDTTGHRGLTA